MHYTNIDKSLCTFTFTVGFTTDEQKYAIFRATKKIDPNSTYQTAPIGTMINGERVSRTLFQFIVEPGEERELFFKLKLQYSAFTLHPSAGHAILVAYGPV